MKSRFFNLKAVLAVVVCILLASGFSATAVADDWTFMVYIGGDNNLSEAAEQDIEEMRSATFGNDVNVIVLAELSNQHSFSPPSYLKDYETHLLRIAGGAVTDIGGNLGNMNLGDPATLSWFINEVVTNYPATYYALTLWDHGDGWRNRRWPDKVRRGAIEDQTSGSFMSLGQLADGVGNSGHRMDVIDFDACLMAMYEVAYEFIGLTDYMVFAEEIEPGDGNPYKEILDALGSDSTMNPAALCGTIVARFNNSYLNGRDSVTKSAVDMAHIPALHTGVKELATALRGIVSTNWPNLNSIIGQTQSYMLKPNKDLVHFLKNLSVLGGDVATKAEALAALVTNNVVISEAHYTSTYTGSSAPAAPPNVDNSHGLAIFLPTAGELQEGEFTQYRNISSNADGGSWDNFLYDFLIGSSGGGAATAGTYEMQNGGFAFLTTWVDDTYTLFSGDADVDLYVFEPDGTLGSPWLSQSTPNGYFSPDSFAIDEPYEMYCAKDRVITGAYYVLVNYFRDGFYDDYANVYVLYMDPGDTFWKLIPDPYRRMHCYNPAPDVWTNEVLEGIISGYYSDWWIPAFYRTRANEDSNPDNLKEMLLKAKAMSDKRKKVNLQNNLNYLFNFLQTDGNEK